MQREIKFRVWNGEAMISPNYVDRKGIAFWKENSVPTYSDKVMQYTGMKDKNGVEIYEGDIVQTVAPDGVRLSKFRIFWSEAGCRFMKHREDDNFFELDMHQTLLEVIGNIYEHQNILT